MERRQDNRDTHRSFNEVLNSTIQRGQDLLSRNFINYDYVESERKDIYQPSSSSQRLTSRSRSPPRSGQKYNYVASSGYGVSASKRVDGAGRTVDSRREYNDDTSPLKDYISRKIDTHLDRLRGPPAKESRTITETPFDHRTDVRGEPIQFESQVQESDQTELARRKLSEERRRELNDEHFNHHRHASSHLHNHPEHSYDEIHDSKAKHDNGDLRENVDFQISENRAQNHKHVRLADSTIDATNHTYLKHRQMVDRITASHHDSPARESKLFDQTEHEVHHGTGLTNTFHNTGSNWPEEGHPQEDQWTKTSRSIDRLEKRQQEIESARKYRGGHAAEEEIERELFEKSLQDGRKVANNLRFGTSYYGETSQSRVHDTLRLRALEDMSPAQVGAGETSVIIQDNAYLVNLYHSLKQRAPRLERQTLKFAATRINPPRCLLDVLDALFSLVYGVYPKVGHDYFANQDRKYFEYKVFFQTMDELVDTIKHLKLYLETQGLPIRNIIAADKAICRYQKTVKRIEAKPYIDTTEEISKFVLYYLEYYNVLRVATRFLTLETESRGRIANQMSVV